MLQNSVTPQLNLLAMFNLSSEMNMKQTRITFALVISKSSVQLSICSNSIFNFEFELSPLLYILIFVEICTKIKNSWREVQGL